MTYSNSSGVALRVRRRIASTSALVSVIFFAVVSMTIYDWLLTYDSYALPFACRDYLPPDCHS